MTYSHHAKAGAKAKKSNDKQMRSKNKRQSSKTIFVFARCEFTLRLGGKKTTYNVIYVVCPV